MILMALGYIIFAVCLSLIAGSWMYQIKQWIKPVQSKLDILEKSGLIGVLNDTGITSMNYKTVFNRIH